MTKRKPRDISIFKTGNTWNKIEKYKQRRRQLLKYSSTCYLQAPFFNLHVIYKAPFFNLHVIYKIFTCLVGSLSKNLHDYSQYLHDPLQIFTCFLQVRQDHVKGELSCQFTVSLHVIYMLFT